MQVTGHRSDHRSGYRSQATGQVTGHRSDHRPQVRSQVRSQVTHKNNRTLDFKIKAHFLHYFQLIAAIPPDLKRKAFGSTVPDLLEQLQSTVK